MIGEVVRGVPVGVLVRALGLGGVGVLVLGRLGGVRSNFLFGGLGMAFISFTSNGAAPSSCHCLYGDTLPLTLVSTTRLAGAVRCFCGLRYSFRLSAMPRPHHQKTAT